MQYLFTVEVAGDGDGGADGINDFLSVQREAEEEAGVEFAGVALEKWREAADFARELVEAVGRDRPRLDRAIASAAQHWDFARIAATDKCALRVAAAELLRDDLGFAIVVNEAVRLAQTFGGPDSGSFVNGVLSGINVNAPDEPVADADAKPK